MISANIFERTRGRNNEFRSRKITKAIFPNETITIGNKSFKLNGIISHVGGRTLEFGHFVTEILRGDDILLCNDESITERQSLSQYGYVFVYSNSENFVPEEITAEQNSKDIEDIICESCSEPFKFTSILRHLSHDKNCQANISTKFLENTKQIVAEHKKQYHKTYNQNYYEKNQDNVRKQRKRRHEMNMEEENLRSKDYHNKNKDAHISQMKDWHNRNQDVHNSQKKDWHNKNQDVHNSQMKEWHNKNKDAHNLQKKNLYQQKKDNANATTNAQIRFKKFKEETMEGKMLNILPFQL